MKLLKEINKEESGQTFILVLIMLLLGGLIIASLLGYMSTGLTAGQICKVRMDELYAADSGVEDALWQIVQNVPDLPKEGDPAYSYSIIPVNDKNVDVDVEHVETRYAEVTYVVHKITSTGSANGRSTSIESYVEVARSPFGAAIIVKDGGAKLEGATVMGSIWANGEIELQSSTVTGEIREHYNPEGGFPELDTTWYVEQAKGPGDMYVHDGDIILGAGNYVLGPAYIDGYLKIEEAATVELNGIIYVTGKTLLSGRAIHIEAGATITGSGTEDPLALIAEKGNIKIELCTFDVDPLPLIWAVSGDIENIEENQYITAILYAPQGNIKFEDDVEIYGAVFASTLDTAENTLVTYASSEDSTLIVEGPTIFTWEISLA
jgi:hypothetical protein